MKNFIKKYWPHAINITLLICYIAIFSILNINYNSEAKPPRIYDILMLLAPTLSVIGVWAEIIYFMIKVITSKELNHKVLRCLGIWFLNIFYIPCLNIKHICKDEKHKNKNIIYLVVSILLYCTMVGLISRYEIITYRNLRSSINQDSITELYESDDGMIDIYIPQDYGRASVGEYDMYFTNEESNIGIFIYNDEADSALQVMDAQEQWLMQKRKNCKLISMNSRRVDDKNIITKEYEAEVDRIRQRYCLSTVSFDKNEKYIVYIIQTCQKSEYDKYKDQYEKMINSIVLKK